MFFIKFSFVLTLLAFLFMSTTALPVPFGTSEARRSAPGSLLGRTYAVLERASESVDVIAARDVTGDSLAVVARAPVAVPVSSEDGSFMPRSERFQRRVAHLAIAALQN